MTETSTIFESFFETIVLQMFQAVTEVLSVPDMEGTTFTFQVKLTGENGTQCGITIKDAREISVTPAA
ncbi:MAG: hypothetical protein SWK76_13275 [Actinomycetota bacterium]|nr:hypothetical protein [Actinomycetota bacterium]